LTDKSFSRRLKDYFEYHDTYKMKDMTFLKFGRHFRYFDAKIIVGRNEMENNWLAAAMKEDDILLQIKDVMGPNTLLRNYSNPQQMEFAAQLTLRYSDSKNKQEILHIQHGKSKPWTEKELNRENKFQYKPYLL
jgi:hypothetical protein